MSAETHARLDVQVIIPFRSPPPWSFVGAAVTKGADFGGELRELIVDFIHEDLQ